MKWHDVLLAGIFSVYGGLASGTEILPSSQLKASSLQMAALGAPVYGIEPIGIKDIPFLEPVCALIFKHFNLLEKDRRLGQWYVQLKGSALLNLPENNIAKGANSFHHYCWAKVAEYRYYREMNPMKKAGLAQYAASNYKFIIDHPEYRPARWPYLPVMYLDYGNALLLGGKLSQSALAIDAFETALRSNKAFVPARISLADIYEKLGQKSKALEYVTESLRYKPASKELKRRYEELGGKPPYPEPYPAPPNSPAEELDPLETIQPERNAEASSAGITPVDKEVAQPSGNGGQNLEQSAASAVRSPASNPYCRFCP